MEKIKLLFNKLPNKHSAGPDKISTNLLKKILNSLCLPLSLIFQKSFNNSDLPDDWKRANLVPVFKGKDNKYDVNNYRPIKLSSTIGKIIEIIIHNHVTEQCEKLKLLHSAQHGFRNKYSTASNLLKSPNDLTCYVTNGQLVDLKTIDFSKAFDSISHKKINF